MTAQHSDSFALSLNGSFQNRVQTSLVAACIAISNESTTVVAHVSRRAYVGFVLNNPQSLTQQFSLAVATDTSCLADATSSGTIPVTSTNSNAQEALVTDAHIDNAVSAMFNAFVSGFST